MLPQTRLKIEAATCTVLHSSRKALNHGLKITPTTEHNSKLPLRQTKAPNKLPSAPGPSRLDLSYKNIANNKKQHSEADCKAKTGIPVSKRIQSGRPGFKYGDVDLTKYKQKLHPRIVIETKQNDFERHLQGGESHFLRQKEKVETFTKVANKDNETMVQENQVCARKIKPKDCRVPEDPRTLRDAKEKERNFSLQKENAVTPMDEASNDSSFIDGANVCDPQIQPEDVDPDSDLNAGAENVSAIKYDDDENDDTVGKSLSRDSDASRTLNSDDQTDDSDSEEVFPDKPISVSLKDLDFEEFSSEQSNNSAENLDVGDLIHTVIIGTEILNHKEQLYIQRNRTGFIDRCMDLIKSNSQIKCQIFEDLTKSPILSVTHTRSELGKHFEGYENLQFIVKSRPGSSSTDLQSQSVALVINCSDCPVMDCVLHTAEIFICDGMIKLGSCEFLSCEPSSTSLLLKNTITAEGFVVRISSDESTDLHPSFKVLECFDLDNPEIPADPLDDEKDGPVVSLISSLKSPKECLALTFTKNLSSLSKALILSGALLINYDLLKNR